MDGQIRVLHIPGRTPYARKLRGHGIAIVNETMLDGVSIPRGATFAWLAAARTFDFFDVLHIQSVEFSRLNEVRRVFERCAQDRKAVVLTIHEVDALFPLESQDFFDCIMIALRNASAVLTLTDGCAAAIEERFALPRESITVVPAGHVLPLSHPLWRQPVTPPTECFSLGAFGGFRANRSFISVAINSLYGLSASETRITILARGLNPNEITPQSEAWQIALLAALHERLNFALSPFPSDDDVANFVSGLDALVLPYLYGTHSGQLELAMDLGVPIVLPRIGFYADQWRVHAASVPEPFWFDYDPADPYSFGGPFLVALQEAYTAWRYRRRRKFDREQFHVIRTQEQREILRTHLSIYRRSLGE